MDAGTAKDDNDSDSPPRAPLSNVAVDGGGMEPNSEQKLSTSTNGVDGGGMEPNSVQKLSTSTGGVDGGGMEPNSEQKLSTSTNGVDGGGMEPNSVQKLSTSTNGVDGGGMELNSVQKLSIRTGGVDGGRLELDSIQHSRSSSTGGVDEGAAEPVQKKPKIRVPKISRKGKRAIVSCVLSIVVGVLAGVFIGFRMNRGGYDTPALLGDICGTTLYPDTCNSTLFGTDTTSPKTYVSKSMSVSMTSTNSTLTNFTQCILAWPPLLTGMQHSTLQMCVEMYQDMLSAETTFLATLNSIKTVQPDVAVVNDLEQRASAALVYHFTCVNGLEEQGLWRDGGDHGVCGVDLGRSTELLSNTLSLVDMFEAANNTVTVPSRRKLLNFPKEGKTMSIPKASRRMLYPMDESRSPTWLSTIDRRILQSSSNDNITTNAVVALDGSGHFMSIQAAVDEAPSNSSQRYVIYIKAGTYDEQVRVPEDKIRLTFVGDGPGATIITGNVSSGVHNVSAVFTATVTVLGDFFMAKNLTIRNTAGPNGREAVALRTSSNLSGFLWITIEAYQNTLYAHAGQQFYSYCTILGTVDSIFGSAAAVFQNCSLLARPPNPGQTITYTASDISSSLVQKYAGLVFQSCLVNASSAFEVDPAASQQLVFLGRPRQSYARTVFIKSQLGALVNRAGWTTSNDTTSTNSSDVSHVEFAEYQNFGPGSEFVADRVQWSKQLTSGSVLSYGVDEFLKGYLWLPAMNVSYSSSI